MLEFLIDDKFIKCNDRIAVGVSGGADSMLLLWALIDKQKKLNFDMTVIHVNHNIRETSSLRDQKFVEEFCKKRKIKQITINIDVKTCKNNNKLTLEEAARGLRYKAFFDVMKKNKLNKLFLAHHKNDQVETILMHIFRGAGIAGASGIRQSENIIRPLLNLTKNEILTMCKDYAVDFVQDETNFENDYSRNYVRNIIIPEIEKIYPGAVDAIFKFGRRCEEIQKFIENSLNLELIEKKENDVLIKEAIFDSPNFIVRAYINEAFKKAGVFEDIESKHYELIYELKNAEVNKQINLPHKIIAKRTYSGIKLIKEKNSRPKQVDYQFIIGTFDFGELGTIETKFVKKEDIVYGNGLLFVDYDKISNSAVWRTRKQGDVFAKLGTGAKKLNDYFTDKKIDIDVRDNIPVLAANDQILLVANEDISEKVKIDASTDKIVAVRFIFN